MVGDCYIHHLGRGSAPHVPPKRLFLISKLVVSIHVFGDASKRAYGAEVYLVKIIQVAFVMSKSNINPKKDESREGEKELSIPKAEWMASYIGTLLAETIIVALEPLGLRSSILLWSDSQIVHFWISKTDSRPRPFITNRVKDIREFNHRRAAT